MLEKAMLQGQKSKLRLQGARGGWRKLITKGNKENLGGDGNNLDLDCRSGCMTVSFVKILNSFVKTINLKRVDFTVCKLYLKNLTFQK